jgi:hypothetical protein
MMPRLPGSPGIVILAFALAVAGCKSGGGPDDTSREISGAELSQMVLELGLFGPEYAAFTPDSDNTGALTFDKAAADDFDPVAERADLKAFKYLSGHEAFFSGNEPAGMFFLGSQVEVFETADGAADYFADTNIEIGEDVGKMVDGTTLEAAETFQVDVADEAVGARAVLTTIRDDGSIVEFRLVTVSFRHGRILGSIGMYTAGATDLEKRRLEGKIESLAEIMNENMAAVLALHGATGAPAAAGGN